MNPWLCKPNLAVEANLWIFQLYNQETLLEWIIFHDVAVTSKIYVRTVCPVRYEWVRDLLPRLHQVDAYELSSVAREEVTEEEITKWELREELKRQCGKHSAHPPPCLRFSSLFWTPPTLCVCCVTFWARKC